MQNLTLLSLFTRVLSFRNHRAYEDTRVYGIGLDLHGRLQDDAVIEYCLVDADMEQLPFFLFSAKTQQ